MKAPPLPRFAPAHCYSYSRYNCNVFHIVVYLTSGQTFQPSRQASRKGASGHGHTSGKCYVTGILFWRKWTFRPKASRHIALCSGNVKSESVLSTLSGVFKRSQAISCRFWVLSAIWLLCKWDVCAASATSQKFYLFFPVSRNTTYFSVSPEGLGLSEAILHPSQSKLTHFLDSIREKYDLDLDESTTPAQVWSNTLLRIFYFWIIGLFCWCIG